MLLFNILHLPVTILLALIIVFVNRQKINKNIRSLLLLYLAVNFIIELTANMMETNIALYNAGMVIEITIFLIIYYRSIPEIKIKKGIGYIIPAFLLFALINALFIQHYRILFSNTYIVGCVVLMFISLYYLFNIVILREQVNPLKSFLFWFSIGVLFCYLGNLPYLSILNTVINSKNEILKNNLAYISETVNTLLYLLIITGAICQINTTKTVLAQ